MLPKANEINKHLELFVPDSLNITDDGKLKEISEAIRKFYFDGKAFTSNSVTEFVKVYIYREKKFNVTKLIF